MNITINPEFKSLIRPLTRPEYLQLEENLLADGCLDPIITWNNFIIDGHNRYEICTRHNIPFNILAMEFSCKEAVVSWICKHQLGRRNITEETRKYLIGMQYEAEKTITAKKNHMGKNQHSESNNELPESDSSSSTPCFRTRNKTAHIIADENHVTHATVQKYAIYTRALNSLKKRHPTFVANILSGKYKIAHKSIIDLSKMSNEEIKAIENQMMRQKKSFVHYSSTRQAMSEAQKQALLQRLKPEKPATPTIKDMPVFDPDAPLIELSLTIPSWASSIKRAQNNITLASVSPSTKEKSILSLTNLKTTIDDLLSTLMEDDE